MSNFKVCDVETRVVYAVEIQPMGNNLYSLRLVISDDETKGAFLVTKEQIREINKALKKVLFEVSA